MEQHLRHCDLVASGDPSFSKEYGVNVLSVLNEAPQFDLCVCLPHDIMHVLFEGVVPRHCKALLRYCILVQQFFKLQQLNRRIEEFSYGYSEKANVPRPLDRDHLTSDNKLVQSGTCKMINVHMSCFIFSVLFLHAASQMWLLGRLLPLIIGDYVPNGDPHWICYIELISILVLSTAVEVPPEMIDDLGMAIENYLFHYNGLYPDSMTPKMHYLLHLPEQIKQ